MNHSNKIEKTTPISWGSSYDLACTALALVMGLVVGWLDLHVTEVVVTILALLIVGLVAGLLQPAAAWRWPILIVIGLPIMAVIARVTQMQTAEPAQLDIRIVLVALLFAFVGSYAGVLIRHTIRALTAKADS